MKKNVKSIFVSTQQPKKKNQYLFLNTQKKKVLTFKLVQLTWSNVTELLKWYIHILFTLVVLANISGIK